MKWDYRCLAIIALEFVCIPCFGDWEAVQRFEDVGVGACTSGDSVWSFPIFHQLSFPGVLVAHVRPTEDEVSRIKVFRPYFPVVSGGRGLFDDDFSYGSKVPWFGRPKSRLPSRRWGRKGFLLWLSVVWCGMPTGRVGVLWASSPLLPPTLSSSPSVWPCWWTLLVHSPVDALPKWSVVRCSTLLSANCIPLSVITSCGTPNLDRIFLLKSLIAFAGVILASSSASIHLVR